MSWSGWFDILARPADVSKVKPAHDDVLKWNNTTRHWEPKNVSVLSAADFVYFGATDTDGTWRIGRVGTKLVFQLRVLGTYITKGAMLP